MDAVVKQETVDVPPQSASSLRLSRPHPFVPPPLSSVVDLSSSDSDSDVDASDPPAGGPLKKRKSEPHSSISLPLGFLDPLPPDNTSTAPRRNVSSYRPRQFWKAGDFQYSVTSHDSAAVSAGMDHVRVHPKFLHSNATSHKWALGAFAELLDNSLDEVCNGATYAKIDVLENKKDGSKMLLIEDNGGGMDPDKMRQCMSLGYSVKSKLANTIGQYGNGFKTSTMRLGADVIVFSRHRGKDGKCSTQSIGMLSYTFLTKTGKEDIVVPMLDFEKKGSTWTKVVRSSSSDWETNFGTILSWSPYLSKADLLQEFDSMMEQGTRIIIYNLWDDDEGRLELDFHADSHDIQLGGVNRDEKKIQMAAQFPNSRHFLTYHHSLRSYASILYRRLPKNFKIILRGKEVEHHNIVNDLMLCQEVTYKPQGGADGIPKDPNLVAVVTIGFVKDAKDHIDVQGFNVYHKNRLIKPFWRVWNASGSDGRGVIGVLEANFVEPAHDKQGFERTTVLSRLEARLVQMQKSYWSTYCHRIGYAPRRHKKSINDLYDRDSSPEDFASHSPSGQHSRRDACIDRISPVGPSKDSNKMYNANKPSPLSNERFKGSDRLSVPERIGTKTKTSSRLQAQSHSSSGSDSEAEHLPTAGLIKQANGFKNVCTKEFVSKPGYSSVSPSTQASAHRTGNRIIVEPNEGMGGIMTEVDLKVSHAIDNVVGNEILSPELTIEHLKEENADLKYRLKKIEESMLYDLEQEKGRCKLLAEKLEEAERNLEAANKEQEALIDIFSEERIRRDKEEESLRNKLKDAAATIQELLHKLAAKRST